MNTTTTTSSFTMTDLLNVKKRLSELSSPAGSVRLPEIRTSLHMVEQYRFPTTKKRRIRNKWRKRSENWRPMRAGLWDKVRNVYYCHPTAKAELMRGLHSRNADVLAPAAGSAGPTQPPNR